MISHESPIYLWPLVDGTIGVRQFHPLDFLRNLSAPCPFSPTNLGDQAKLVNNMSWPKEDIIDHYQSWMNELPISLITAKLGWMNYRYDSSLTHHLTIIINHLCSIFNLSFHHHWPSITTIFDHHKPWTIINPFTIIVNDLFTIIHPSFYYI